MKSASAAALALVALAALVWGAPSHAQVTTSTDIVDGIFKPATETCSGMALASDFAVRSCRSDGTGRTVLYNRNRLGKWVDSLLS